jgi:thiosulfate/3-mercaptopyruvate sulfurtransferase
MLGMHTTLISSYDVMNRPVDEDWAIVDCRFDLADLSVGRKSYEASHIPGAVFVDLHLDSSDQSLKGKGRHPLPTPEKITKLFGRLGISQKTQVVIYDQFNAAYAARLWWMFRYMGHDAVCVLDGGFQSWLGDGNPVHANEESRPPVKFYGTPRKEQLIPVEQVQSSGLLVDSRDPKRYRGEIETIDPVAGHIPNAKNRFFRLNVTESGHFRPKEELRKEFEELFTGSDPSRAGFYCGSGVTACHNILAAVHAGLPESRLYAGSWSEWCSDPKRPVEKSL